jgi:hypothetical protein
MEQHGLGSNEIGQTIVPRKDQRTITVDIEMKMKLLCVAFLCPDYILQI